MVRRHGHREVHLPDAPQRGGDALRPGQVTDDDLGSEGAQPGRAVVVVADQYADGRVLCAQLLEDPAAHVTGVGEEN